MPASPLRIPQTLVFITLLLRLLVSTVTALSLPFTGSLFESARETLRLALSGSVDAVAKSPLPLPVSGQCTAGLYSPIKLVDDFKASELECLWAAAVVPLKPPLGHHFGRLLAFTNTEVLNLFTRTFYQGDYTFDTQCAGRTHTVGVLKMGGASLGYAIWSINPFPRPIVSGEYYDGRPAIVMDFSIDLKSLCRGEGSDRDNRLPYDLYSMRPFQSSPWPNKLFIDLLRIVGCDPSDGGIFLLGRTFMLDPEERLNRPAFTVLYFTLKTFDQSIKPPGFKCDDNLLLNESFEYTRHGGDDFLSRLDPRRYWTAFKNNDLPNGMFGYTN